MVSEGQQSAILDLSDGFFFFFISVSFDRTSYVTRDLSPRSFFAMITSSRSISIKLSAVVGVDNRIIARSKMIVCRVGSFGSINLNLNLSFSREYAARNPRCFFDL